MTLNLTFTISLLKNMILFSIIVTFYLPTVTLFLVWLFNRSIYSTIANYFLLREVFTLFLICHKAALNPFSPLLQIWEKHRETHWNYAGLRLNISSDVRTHLVDTSFRTQSFLWHLYSVQAIGAINFMLYWNMDSLTNQRENVTVKKSKELSVLSPLARLKMQVILFQKNQFPMPMF